MYLKYYRLRAAPFAMPPDPAFLYLSKSHEEVLASLLYALEERKGFVALTGDVGAGKTLLLRALLEKIDVNRVEAVYLFNPELSFAQLMRSIFLEMGQPFPQKDLDLAVRRLHHHLIERYRQGRHVVLLIDEAQRMPAETLERLRILSNLETAKHKLLQIVLCGQTELDKVLDRHDLRQLRQRIALRAFLGPLSRKESVAYLEHRLARVSYSRTPIFSPKALARIVRHAQGNPRVLNSCAEYALIAGYAEQERPVSAKTAAVAIAEQARKRRPALISRWKAVAAGALVVLFLLAFWGRSVALRPHPAGELGRAPRAPVSKPSAAQNASTTSKGRMQERVLARRHDAADVAQAEAAIPAYPSLFPLLMPPPDAFDSLGSGGHEGIEAATPTPLPVMHEVPDAELLECEKEGAAQEASAVAGPDAGETWKIAPGECLGDILARVYGYQDVNLLKRVLEENPHIQNPDQIHAGDTIRLPTMRRDSASTYE